jgi:hypothetical protein
VRTIHARPNPHYFGQDPSPQQMIGSYQLAAGKLTAEGIDGSFERLA